MDLDRFGKVSMKSGIKVSNEMISLRPFTLVLDETSIDGRVDLGLQPLNIDLELLADQLNIDQYLVNSKIRKQHQRPTIVHPISAGHL